MLTKLSLEIQNSLAKKIQNQFPVIEKPFAHLAKEFSITEEEVLNQIKEWKEQKYLREISAVVEGEVFDFESALVGAEIPLYDLERVVGFLKEHPMVTHLYLRNYTINLWFTIAIEKEIGLERHLEEISSLLKYPFYTFRRTQTFKIGVNFDLISKKNQTEKKDLKKVQKFPKEELTEKIKQIIRAIQTPLPIEDQPFKKLAKDFDIKEEEIIKFIQTSPYGSVRKYVATFQHRNLGVSYNAMVVWQVPETQMEEMGNQLSQYPEVSHCYARTYLERFPYNLYSMIHSADEVSGMQLIKKIARDLKIRNYLVLYSPVEYKKTRLRYFTQEWGKFITKYGFYTAKYKK